MKINSKILSIPPYISTSWENVISLQVEETSGKLIIFLKNNAAVSIPNLSKDLINEVFQVHTNFLESLSKPSFSPKPQMGFNLGVMPQGFIQEALGPIMGHDAKQKNSPDLPSDVINKVASVAKALSVEIEGFNLPSDEPHCNCPYCQIARAIQGKQNPNKIPDIDNSLKETEVLEGELKFREWDIKQLEKELYDVTNPNDVSEHYQVFLGHPIGCTCGKSNCEHIRAVLNT
ncbi:MAG: hypothetical protein FJZ59_07420 [Chlamydiae bacterium]|nr:hypothetical protein [Chlamydiota bacterium]